MDLNPTVQFLHPDGTLGEFRPFGSGSGGRTFDLPPGAVVVSCRLRLTRRPEATIRKDIKQRLRVRKAAEPFALASAGYVWKNPGTGPVEKLINAVGLRGKRLNGAEISAKSSNFIINRGGASPADVLALMDMTRERVRTQFRVEMFNLLNRANLPIPGSGGASMTSPPGTKLNSSSFGRIFDTVGDYNGAPGIGAGEPFNVQLALKILF